jgi:hypothetical protein
MLALLGSSLSAKHEAFRNRKLLRGKIQQKKDEKVPAGYQWQGEYGLKLANVIN